ncbi:hypothetical protein L7F22_002849 [Adiantum nelumboides]|nr:hypothetical protein [Adiantum nelumboides]
MCRALWRSSTRKTCVVHCGGRRLGRCALWRVLDGKTCAVEGVDWETSVGEMYAVEGVNWKDVRCALWRASVGETCAVEGVGWEASIGEMCTVEGVGWGDLRSALWRASIEETCVVKGVGWEALVGETCTVEGVDRGDLVKKLKLTETPCSHKYVVEQMSGNDKEIWETMVQGIELIVQAHTMTLDFQVMNTDRADVVLRWDRLHGLGNTLHTSFEHNFLFFMANGKHVLFLGEKNIPFAPLICIAELSFLQKTDLLDEVFLCYCLSPSLVNSQEQSAVNSSYDIQSTMKFYDKQSVTNSKEQSAFNSNSIEQRANVVKHKMCPSKNGSDLVSVHLDAKIRDHMTEDFWLETTELVSFRFRTDNWSVLVSAVTELFWTLVTGQLTGSGLWSACAGSGNWIVLIEEVSFPLTTEMLAKIHSAKEQNNKVEETKAHAQEEARIRILKRKQKLQQQRQPPIEETTPIPLAAIQSDESDHEDSPKEAEAPRPSEYERSDKEDASTPLDKKSKRPRSREQILMDEAMARVEARRKELADARAAKAAKIAKPTTMEEAKKLRIGKAKAFKKKGRGLRLNRSTRKSCSSSGSSDKGKGGH